MLKSYKNATLWAVILWALIFIVWSIIIFVPVLKDSLLWQWIIHYIVLIFLVWLCAANYFKKAGPSAKSGICLGIYFVIIGAILDAIVTVPLFVKDWGFYSQWQLWVGYAVVIIVSILVGSALSKKGSKPTPVTEPKPE